MTSDKSSQNTSTEEPREQSLFSITRVLGAPLERVWQAWTAPEQLALWWGPKGCTVDVRLLEFRPGGFFHYSMSYPGAPKMWGRFNYREISDRQRIVWLNSFSNEKCGITRAPFSQLCPLEIQNTVTFEESDGATIVSLQAVPFGETADERQYFIDLKPSLEQATAAPSSNSSPTLKKKPAGRPDQWDKPQVAGSAARPSAATRSDWVIMPTRRSCSPMIGM
jgi:uncharacterized protein YndB with AHSA1/START domain